MSEAVLWSFSVELDQHSNLVLVKRRIKIDDLKTADFQNELPMAELTEVLDYLNSAAATIEQDLEAIIGRR